MTAVTLLAGGFGGAKMAHGFAQIASERALDVSVVVNTGDDLELHGLAISPDLDTVMYTLAGLANAETGWGVRDETWSGAGMLERYGEHTWFRLGDRDLATHVLRSARLRSGQRLTDVTVGLSSALGVAARILPMSDDRVRTRIRTPDGWMDFQDWFVRRGHADPAIEVLFDGIDHARPTPEALDAIGRAELIVLAPSNPFVSVGTILALPTMVDALTTAAAPIVAVSPIVGGAALRGPADRMFESLGGDASALGVARHYVERNPGLLDAMVIDDVDASAAPAIQGLGLEVLVAQTVMADHGDRASLAATIADRFVRPSPSAPYHSPT